MAIENRIILEESLVKCNTNPPKMSEQQTKPVNELYILQNDN